MIFIIIIPIYLKYNLRLLFNDFPHNFLLKKAAVYHHQEKNHYNIPKGKVEIKIIF